MQGYIVDLDIPAAELARYYRGAARAVVASARSGQRVRFPVDALRRHVGHGGVHGTFLLRVNGRRLTEIRRLA